MMKKLSLLVGLIVLFCSCSSDDSAPVNQNPDGIAINGISFTPENGLTFFNDTNNTRRLSLLTSIDGFVLNFPSASAENNISGNYDFNPASADLDSHVSGFYSTNNTAHSIFSGTLSITDFGNGTYMVRFNDVKIYSLSDSRNPMYQIDGFYQGVFSDVTSTGKIASARPVIF